MSLTARDIMVKDFYTLAPDQTIPDAVRQFAEASRELKRQVFGMVVTDGEGRLKGMLSKYDVLLLIRPKHITLWGEMSDVDTSGLLEEACRRTQEVRVGDVMTPQVITLPPDAHIFKILDLMLNKHVRRIPIVEHEHILGMVYLSGVFQAVSAKLQEVMLNQEVLP